MTNLDKFLAEVKARSEKATKSLAMPSFSDFRKEMERTRAIAELEKHARNDIPRLVRMVETLIKQRNGYRDNYWEFCKPCAEDRRRIIEDDDDKLDCVAEQAAP